MPELPEVEIVRRQLHRWFTGNTVSAEVYDPAAVRTKLSSKPSDAAPKGVELLKAALGQAEEPLRHGKRLAWPFGSKAVLIHLGMTGTFKEQHEKSARIRFDHVYFIDRRRFGCVTVVDRDEMELALRGGLGPDALLEPMDATHLQSAFTGRRGIKVALMDQAKLSGLGNIHAAEALWRAGIDPRRPCNQVQRWQELADAIVAQLEDTITAEESGELVYVTDGGPNRFAVYGRDGEDCPKCAEPIESLVQGGRSTFFCASCQPP